MTSVVALQKRLSYNFSNQLLLQQALTHRSAGEVHNERLEFLGDVVLSAVISNWLFLDFPHFSEGELSESRSQLVNKKQLVSLARTLELNTVLILGPGEQQSGGHYRESILADALEALIGAIFLDSNWIKVEEVIKIWYAPILKKLGQGHLIKHSKSLLQEYAQANQLELPIYRVMRTVGKAHQRVFYVSCRLADLSHVSHGHGRSKQQAEELAADAYIIWLKEQKDGGS